MVALLLELLLDTPLDIYVVSTPQNTFRENNLEACVRSLLRFSPIFGRARYQTEALDSMTILSGGTTQFWWGGLMGMARSAV